MWLHLPKNCLSVQEWTELVLESDSPCNRIARSVSWSGKLSRPSFWSRLWRRVSYLRRLSGATLHPSTATRGVERWISSLRDTPVSLSASPERSSPKRIPAISGRTSSESSKSAPPHSSSSRMSDTTSVSDSRQSEETYEDLAIRLNRLYSALRRWARRTNVRGFSLLPPLPWPTPDTRPDAPNLGSNKKNSSACLETLAREATESWATPCAHNAETPNPGGQQKDLNRDAQHWQTPTAQGFKSRGGRQKGQQLLNGEVENWPTPRAEDSEQVGNHASPNSHAGDSLGVAAKAWSTPQAQDSEASGSLKRGSTLNADLQLWTTPKTPTGGPERRGSKKARGSGGEDLETQAQLFETPTTRDGKRSSGARKKENSLPGLPIATTENSGSGSSPDGRKLNPLFDEWLIGLPIGWTCPHRLPGPDASEATVYEQWETASIRVLWRWLSAYWRSGLESADYSGSARTKKT